MAKGKPASRQLNRDKSNRREVDPEKAKQGRGKDTESPDQEKIAWAFGAMDKDGDWGWRTQASAAWWKELLPKLQNFETMTWIQIMQAAGGRRRGNNHHPVSVEDLTPQARKRLSQIKQNDVEKLFSLRLDGTKRIYGIRDRRVLKMLWYDPNHGNNAMAVCPANKIRT